MELTASEKTQNDMYQHLIQLPYEDVVKLFSRNDGLNISTQMVRDYIKSFLNGKEYEDAFWFEYNMGLFCMNDYIVMLRVIKNQSMKPKVSL